MTNQPTNHWMYQWKVNPLICCWVIKCSDFLLFTHLIRGNAGKAGFGIVYQLLKTWERSYFCVYVTIIFMFIYGVVFVFFVYYCFHTEKGRDLCVVPVGWPDWILVNWEQKLPTLILPQDLPVNSNGIYILHDARTRTNPMSINCANPMSISQWNPMTLWQRNWMLQPLGKFFGPYLQFFFKRWEINKIEQLLGSCVFGTVFLGKLSKTT